MLLLCDGEILSFSLSFSLLSVSAVSNSSGFKSLSDLSLLSRGVDDGSGHDMNWENPFTAGLRRKRAKEEVFSLGELFYIVTFRDSALHF